MPDIIHTSYAHLVPVSSGGFLVVRDPKNVGDGRLSFEWAILDHDARTVAECNRTDRRLEIYAKDLDNENQGIQAFICLVSFLVTDAEDDVENHDQSVFGTYGCEWAANNLDSLLILGEQLGEL